MAPTPRKGVKAGEAVSKGAEEDDEEMDDGGAESASSHRLDEETLTKAAESLESLLESPEWLLDPSAEGAKSAAAGARTFVKLFFESAQAQCPARLKEATAIGAGGIVVDGFDHEQIWEELEVQNIPLRRHLRHRLSKLADAPVGAVDLALGGGASTSAASRKAPETAQGKAKKTKQAATVDEDDEDGGIGGEGLDDSGDGDEGAEEPRPDKKKQDTEKRAKGEKKGTGSAGASSEFFSWDDYDKFADMADAKLKLDDDADDSDFDLLEADEAGSDDEAAQKATFADFFDPLEEGEGGSSAKVAKAVKQGKGSAKAMEDDEDEEENGDDEKEEDGLPAADDDLEGLSDEEKELEKKIRQFQSSEGGNAGGDEEEDEAGEEEDEEDDATGLASDAEADGKKDSGKPESLYEMDKRLRALEDEVAKLEEEQLEEKPWLLRGEISGKHRPLNSLLEVHLEQPMSFFAGRRAEDAAAAGAQPDDDQDDDAAPRGDLAPRRAHFDIDGIIRQRIWDEAFDDVVRKNELPPSQRPQGADDDVAETLNFEKSRVGLADVYAKQYEAELLGHKTDNEEKEDKEKTETKALFAKLMYKLDMLTNAHFTPRPPLLSAATEAKVPALKMEETIPLMISEATLKAPEQIRAPRRHERDSAEMTHEERIAARRSKKERRRRSLQGKVEEGQMSLGGLRERGKVLEQKNAEARQSKLSKGVPKEQHRKRIKASELLAQAAASASSGVTRKEEIRKHREERSGDGPSSKRLKL